MGMTVQRRKDTRTPRVFMHKIADVRGGVSVNSSELGSDWLPEGAVISQPVNGICHVVKVAEVAAAVAESGKTITVKKGSLFNVGDFVLLKVGDKASKITAIDKTGKETDKITIDTALGAIAIGGFLVEAGAASTTTTSALKYEPFAVVGTGKPILPNDNIDTDAWLIGVTKGNPLPECVASELKGIINY
jgi:hypothetical protein